MALKQYQAEYGNGRGLQGNAYAIPTKDRLLQPLTVERISWYVDEFLVFAEDSPYYEFFITRVGCGLAGHTDQSIAPLFKHAPDNCILPAEWVQINGKGRAHTPSPTCTVTEANRRGTPGKDQNPKPESET